MATMTVEEAQGHLKDIIEGLNPGETLVIVQDGVPVATLARTPPNQRLFQKAEFAIPDSRFRRSDRRNSPGFPDSLWNPES